MHWTKHFEIPCGNPIPMQTMEAKMNRIINFILLILYQEQRFMNLVEALENVLHVSNVMHSNLNLFPLNILRNLRIRKVRLALY